MTDPRTVRVDEFLAHPPARVWRALTDPVLLAKWFMPNDFRPVVGHEFAFLTQARPNAEFDGVVHCRVLKVEPERLLRFSWRGGRLDTTVTWTLVAEGRGTRLFLEHDGFDGDDPIQQHARGIMGGGWSTHLSTLDATLRSNAARSGE
ncbi:SRPBCC family protein [Rugosimonospora africana]|uniref:Activator of Hsp90 ATPase homologue 1/2-like C-terminal domain-containing protein n=1 Tax=Rugosimonospora africana TaxID=556532 RepID=A0A8J3R469_9ACTN|nr:SRPBCC domain-containing protein [Rugosimonospora africana]GIH19746.1 hypothetical protein Raf01_79180 [Rugosimonospora africana]